MMKFLHALTIFATVGLALARDFFVKLGFVADYPTIGAIGLAITTFLVFRGILPILGVGILSAMFMLPDETLASYHLDHDILLAAAMLIVLYPWIAKMVRDG